MRTAVIVLLIVPALVLCTGCAATARTEDAQTCIPPEVLAQCAQECGCVLASRARIAQLLGAAIEQACKGAT